MFAGVDHWILYHNEAIFFMYYIFGSHTQPSGQAIFTADTKFMTLQNYVFIHKTLRRIFLILFAKHVKSISVSNLIVKWFIGFRPANSVHRKRTEQWWIQDFPGGAPTPEGGASLLFSKILPRKLHEYESNWTEVGRGRP